MKRLFITMGNKSGLMMLSYLAIIIFLMALYKFNGV
jgi:hypothetical protein